jgi:hypothetical protein
LDGITILLKMQTMIFLPFSIKKFGNDYCSTDEIIIDLNQLLPGQYRIVVVHNFQSEDLNPNLNQCLAGIFLSARLNNQTWQEPEEFPCECRTLSILGFLEIQKNDSIRITPLK